MLIHCLCHISQITPKVNTVSKPDVIKALQKHITKKQSLKGVKMHQDNSIDDNKLVKSDIEASLSRNERDKGILRRTRSMEGQGTHSQRPTEMLQQPTWSMGEDRTPAKRPKDMLRPTLPMQEQGTPLPRLKEMLQCTWSMEEQRISSQRPKQVLRPTRSMEQHGTPSQRLKEMLRPTWSLEEKGTPAKRPRLRSDEDVYECLTAGVLTVIILCNSTTYKLV